MIEIILITITIIALIIATISDLKTHEIPDYLTYALIFVGIAIKLTFSLLTNNFYYILYGVLGLIAMYGVGSILYYTRQWGGGDTKLVMGLGVTLTSPEFIQTNLPFLLILFFNIILIGAVYGLITGFTLAIKNWNKFVTEFKRISKIKIIKNLERTTFIVSLIPLILIFLTKIDNFSLLALFLTINIYMPLLITIRAIEKIVMHKSIQVKKLREGDWLLEPVVQNKKILLKPKPIGLTKQDIKLLIKNKIKSVIIKEGIPFVPAITIATILTLIYPKLFFFI